MRRPITFLIFPAEGIEGHWNAVCLDFNIWSSADSIQGASKMIEGAVLYALEDCDPAAFETADVALWARAHEIITLAARGEGILGDVSAMDANTKAIRRGVLLRTALCKKSDGQWWIGESALPPTPDSVPKAA